MAVPVGKGLYVWQIKDIERGNPANAAQVAADAGISHIIVKTSNGMALYNQRPDPPNSSNPRYFDDIIRPWIAAMVAKGIEVWGFHYTYLNDPNDEAKTAVNRVVDLGLAGLILDVEGECKGKTVGAQQFANYVKTHYDKPVGLASYRYPEVHREVPWSQLLACCTFVMPQVYWASTTATDQPEKQLVKSMDQYAKITKLPYIPTGSAYSEKGWTSSPAQVLNFMSKCDQLQVPGFNFWDYKWARIIPQMWNVIASFDYGGPTPPTPPRVCSVCGYALTDPTWNYCPICGTHYTGG